jgi:tetratricopeptide (TPR) repeat protein
LSYRLGSDLVGLAVRDESYTKDAGGFNNLPDGSLVAFKAYGLPAPVALEVRREMDWADRALVVVSFTAPELAAAELDAAFHGLAQMVAAELTAIEALHRIPGFPQTEAFALPDKSLDRELVKADPKRQELVIAARDALAAVAPGGLRAFWLGAVKATLGDLEGAALAFADAHAESPESEVIAVTSARVLLDLGRNADVVALLSPFPSSRWRDDRPELLALALLRLGRPKDALAALDGRRGVNRARLLDATGDRAGALRELRHAFLTSPDEARRFREGAVRPRALLADAGLPSTLGILVDEDWILAMWEDPKVARLLKANYERDRRGYVALLAVEDVRPFAQDLDVAEDVDPSAVDTAAHADVDPAKRAKLVEAFEPLRTLHRDFDAFPGIPLRLALVAMMLGRRDDALRLFQYVHSRWPANATAERGIYHFDVSPRIEVGGVTYSVVRDANTNTEAYDVIARTGDHVDWKASVSIWTMAWLVKLVIDESEGARRLVLEVDGEHPRGGEWNRDHVYFNPSTGAVLGRRTFGLSRVTGKPS